MIKRVIQTLLLFIPAIHCYSIDIGLFANKEIQSLTFSIVSGNYKIIVDGLVLSYLEPKAAFFATTQNGYINLYTSEKSLGKYTYIEIKSEEENNVFQIRAVNPLMDSRDYDGNLKIFFRNNQLIAVNQVEIDKYVCGVVESEGGSNALIEYYKAQSILVRTYGMKNSFKHAADGYNLCDRVHCQAYKGKSYLNTAIQKAVYDTRGLVVTTLDSALISTPYHSNCGGLTSDGQDAWLAKQPLMRSIRDPFCTSNKNATWIKTIPENSWINYLKNNQFKINKHTIKSTLLSSKNRQTELEADGTRIAFRKIREDWNLKSTFFNINLENNKIVLTGRGFGHGVGLCQEGAMEMAKVGYTYIDIIHFYFYPVNILDIVYIKQQ